MPVIFISYRREDSAGYAGRMHEELEGRLGASQVFRDADTLRAGQDFEQAIRQRLEHCQACVVLIGPNWVKSSTSTGQRRLDQPGDYVCMEIAAALARPGVLVIPVLVGGAMMPAASELPEVIRPLRRRQAITVRDEAWESDMDRLAAALRPPGFPLPSPPALMGALPRRWQAWAAFAVVAVAALFVAIIVFRPGGSQVGSSPLDDTATTAATNQSFEGATYAIDAPGTGAEVALEDLIYVVVSGSVQRRGDGQRVWLRIRVSNEGFYGANFWDDSFRLVVNGQSFAPNGGLNEILERRSIKQGVIRFDVPSHTTAAVLRVTLRGQSGDIPLDLSGNGGPPKHDESDPRDALSHAVFSSIVKDEIHLLDANEVSTAILRIGRRAFVNTQRITVVVRWTNTSRYASATGDLILRLAAGGEVLAPMRLPAEVVAPASTYVGDVVFDVPPGIRTATLRASLRTAETEQHLTLH
jgi:hypothetical protein